VDPVPDLLLFRKSGSAGNRSQTSGSVARNPDQFSTEAVIFIIIITVLAANVVLSGVSGTTGHETVISD
jgi:hypothetical protein